ncbi:hypothetical protein V8C43DRAFT_142160 [Trichoderma afarasin]
MRSIHLFCVYFLFFLLLTLHLVSVFAGALCFSSSSSKLPVSLVSLSLPLFFFICDISSVDTYDTHLSGRIRSLGVACSQSGYRR